MKRQYLGDSKDSFKWDYLHFLVEALGYRRLKIAWVMSADDGGSDGKTAPELFPARKEILGLCHHLRAERDAGLLFGLPATTGAHYTVSIHDGGDADHGNEAGSFFAGVEGASEQVLFLDPDNGFEPERSFTHRHVRYADLDRLMSTVPSDAVVVVFQHHRRKKFADDFARIRERLLSGYSSAVYWQALMFVCLSSSPEGIARVREVNREYARQHPARVLE
jgi:hypothetical protein